VVASLHNDGMSSGPPRFFALVQLESGTVVAGTCTRGLSRSIDGGLTWEPLDELRHVSINAFAVAPDGALLAATSGGLARSVDDARSWDLLDDDPVYSVSPTRTDRPSGVTVYRQLDLPDGRVLAGTDGAGVLASDGSVWRPTGLGRATVYSLAVTPSGAVLAGTRGDGVFRSEDGGDSWLPANDGIPNGAYLHCLLVRPDGAVLAGTGDGVARSVDDGHSWTRWAEPLGQNRIFSLATLADGRLLAGSYTNLWIGDDEDWIVVDPGLTPDEAWAVHFLAGGSIVAGAKIGILRSNDQGASWAPDGTTSVAFAFAETSEGQLLACTDTDVLAAPEWTPVGDLRPRPYALLEVEPGELLVGTLGDGMYRYDGTDWAPVANGPPHWHVYDVIRSRSERLLAGTGGVVDGVKGGGIFISDDRGRTWTPTFDGRSVYYVVETSDGTLYGGGQRCHILRSTDNGDTWILCPPPVPFEAKLYSLLVDREDRIYLGAGGQLLRSDDGARTWTILEDGLDGVTIYSLDEGPDGILGAATSSGVYVSRDGGDTWRPGEIVASVSA
jgi:photosystem II stability/assembly factor-like uncharacterized protein